MNFLVIDDDPQKIKLVTDLLSDCNVLESSIFTAADAVSARTLLAQRDFEIVFLDVLLPARGMRNPSGDISADLLREMSEESALRHPACVIGITADLNAKGAYSEEFGELTSAIFHIQTGSDTWKGPLSKVVNARISRSRSQKAHDYDICVQTALRDSEMISFLGASGVSWVREERLSAGVRAFFGCIEISGRSLTVVCAHASGMGMIPATSLSEKLIERFSPRYLLMTGFCGGVGSDLSLGDLVVADKAWDWQSGKYVEGGFLSGVDQKDGCPDLLAAARKVSNSHDAMARVGVGRIHIAPMVSGSSVVADKSMHDRLIDQHRKVAAIDMEAYGVYYSASVSEPRSSVLCVKGVADLANKAKSDGIQKMCSDASAKFAMEVMRVVVE